KVAIKLNFSKPGNDSIGFSGSLPVAAGFTSAGQKVVTDVGGVVKAFTLDAKGGAKAGNDSFKIAIKAAKGVVADQTSKFAVKMSKGSFTTALADEGLTGDADVKSQPREIVFTVLFDGMVFQVHKTVSYTAKTGKTGS